MSFTLLLTPCETALVVYDRAGSRVEVRGAADYARVHDPSDPLHQALDALDPATVSILMTGDRIRLNPNNPRQAQSFALCERLFSHG